MAELDDYRMEDALERYLRNNADEMSYDIGAWIGYVLQTTLTAMDHRFGYTHNDALIIGETILEQILQDRTAVPTSGMYELPIEMIDFDALHAGISAVCLAYRNARADKKETR